jgi:hypothetical protein
MHHIEPCTLHRGLGWHFLGGQAVVRLMVLLVELGSFGALEKVTASSRVRRAQEQGKFYRPLWLRHPHRA